MKMFKKFSALVVSTAVTAFVICGPMVAFAATTPTLGLSSTFGILSSTYTNTAIGTTINGDLGYTTAPAVLPTINGTKYVAESTYNQAGIDQNWALHYLNGQVGDNCKNGCFC